MANLNPLNPDTDGDGINDAEDEILLIQIPKPIYMRLIICMATLKKGSFQIKKLNYFLPKLDPENNFESDKVFYSNKDFERRVHISIPL